MFVGPKLGDGPGILNELAWQLPTHLATTVVIGTSVQARRLKRMLHSQISQILSTGLEFPPNLPLAIKGASEMIEMIEMMVMSQNDQPFALMQ